MPRQQADDADRRYFVGLLELSAVRFSPERYGELKRLADEGRRSVSEQVEAMIEELAIIREVLAATRTDAATLRDAIFRRDHRPQHTPYGAVWFPTAHPQCPPASGFIDAKEIKP
jgi:hypothetical protein